jgi:hypothetical protein
MQSRQHVVAIIVGVVIITALGEPVRRFRLRHTNVQKASARSDASSAKVTKLNDAKVDYPFAITVSALEAFDPVWFANMHLAEASCNNSFG